MKEALEKFENWEDAYFYWTEHFFRYYSDKDEAEEHGFETGWENSLRNIEPAISEAIEDAGVLIDDIDTFSVESEITLHLKAIAQNIIDKLNQVIKSIDVLEIDLTPVCEFTNYKKEDQNDERD